MRHARIICNAVLVAAAVLSGCRNGPATAQNGVSGGLSSPHAAELNLPSGTSVDVTLTTALTFTTNEALAVRP